MVELTWEWSEQRELTLEFYVELNRQANIKIICRESSEPWPESLRAATGVGFRI